MTLKPFTEIQVIDPESHQPVELWVYRDPESGGLFAIDASSIEQGIVLHVQSPFNPGTLFLVAACQ